jgi:hypothetical protein
VPSGEDDLADDTYFGYLRAVTSADRTIEIDVAQWLSGPDADAASVEDGHSRPGESVSNDYYIRNRSPFTRTILVADAVTVTVPNLAAQLTSVAGSFEGLAASFAPGSKQHPDLADEYRGPSGRYWVTVSGGLVVAIEEQYTP